MAFKIKKTSPHAKNQDTNDANEAADSILGDSPLGNPSDNLAGVESVDRVVLASENVFDWGHRNRKLLFAILAVVIAAVLIVAWSINNSRENRVAQSNKLYDAYIAYIAPVGDERENDEIMADGDPSFDTGSARLNAVYETTKIESGAKSGVAQLTKLLHAATGLELGKDDVGPAMQAYASYASTPLQTSIADVASAVHLASEGDLSGALDRLDALLEKVPELEAPILEQRASLIELYGDRKDALVAWRDAARAAEGTNAEDDLAQRVAVLEFQEGLIGAEDAQQADGQDNE